MITRRYKPKDCNELIKLFYNTVHSINAKDYSQEQLNVWATDRTDSEEWNKSLSEHYTVVAVENNIIVGFGDIDKSGYLDRLYVHKDYQRRGIATAICDELEQAVKVNKIITHSSVTAKRFCGSQRATSYQKRDCLGQLCYGETSAISLRSINLKIQNIIPTAYSRQEFSVGIFSCLLRFILPAR